MTVAQLINKLIKLLLKHRSIAPDTYVGNLILLHIIAVYYSLSHLLIVLGKVW